MSRPSEILPDLGLVGDGDELDLLVGIERSFGVTLGPEAENWFTLGDMSAALVRLTENGFDGRKCASAMAYYRLRKCLGGRGLRPSTELAPIFDGHPVYALKVLAQQTGFDMPAAKSSWIGNLGLAVVVVCAPASLFFASGWIALGFGMAGVGLIRMDRGVAPFKTLGELADHVAATNFARLAAEGASTSEESIWRAVKSIVARQVGMPASEKLDRKTRFFPQ